MTTNSIDDNDGSGTQPVFKLPYVGESSETESKKDWTSIDKILLQDNNFVKPEDKFTDKNAYVSFERIIDMYNSNQKIQRYQFTLHETNEKNGIKTMVYTRDVYGTIDALMMASSKKDGKCIEEMAAFRVENDEDLINKAIDGWVYEKSGYNNDIVSQTYASALAVIGGLSSIPIAIPIGWSLAEAGSVGGVLALVFGSVIGLTIGGACIGAYFDNKKGLKLTKESIESNNSALKQLREYHKVVEGEKAIETIRQIGLDTKVPNE